MTCKNSTETSPIVSRLRRGDPGLPKSLWQLGVPSPYRQAEAPRKDQVRAPTGPRATAEKDVDITPGAGGPAQTSTPSPHRKGTAVAPHCGPGGTLTKGHACHQSVGAGGPTGRV